MENWPEISKRSPRIIWHTRVVSKCLCMKIWPLMVKYENTTKRWTSLSISLILHRRSRLVRFLYPKYLHLKFKLAPQKYFVPLTAPSLKNLEPFLLLTFRRPWEWRCCYQFATGIPSIVRFLSKYLFQHLRGLDRTGSTWSVEPANFEIDLMELTLRVTLYFKYLNP